MVRECEILPQRGYLHFAVTYRVFKTPTLGKMGFQNVRSLYAFIVVFRTFQKALPKVERNFGKIPIFESNFGKIPKVGIKFGKPTFLGSSASRE